MNKNKFINIENAGFSKETVEFIKGLDNCKTLGDLSKHSTVSLSKVSNITKRLYKDLRSVLGNYNLCLSLHAVNRGSSTEGRVYVNNVKLKEI